MCKNIIYFLSFNYTIMNSSNAHVLFYSEKCPHSREFINLISATRYGGIFRKYCIERLSKIPNGIFEVPTIIVPGYNVPLSGDNVFKWFKETAGSMPTMNTRSESFEPRRIAPAQPPRRPPPEARVSAPSAPTTQRSNSNPTSVGGHSSPESNPTDEPSPFGLELSAGFSDIYSYIDDDAGKPLVHAFEYIGENGGASINKSSSSAGSLSTESSRSGSNARDEKSNKFNKEYEEFMMNRNSDPVCNNTNVRQI